METREYYRQNLLETGYRKLFLIPVVVLLISFSVLLIVALINGMLEVFILLLIILLLLISFLVFTFYAVKHLRRAVVTITEERLIILNELNFKKIKLNWQQIRGFIIREVARPFKLRFVDLDKEIYLNLITGDEEMNKKALISLNFLKNREDFIERLKKRIPELTAKYRKGLLQDADGLKEVRYRDLRLMEEGIEKDYLFIPWEKVLEVKTAGVTLAGFSKIKIIYLDTDKPKKITVRPEKDKGYLNFLGYLLNRAEKAVVDNEIYIMFEKGVSGAKVEEKVLLSNIFFFFILFLVEIFLRGYNFSGLSELFIKIVFFLWLISIIIGGFMEQLRKRKGRWDNIKKQYRITLANFGVLLLAVILFFTITPFSRMVLAGDFHMKREDYYQALSYYHQALTVAPEEMEVLYSCARAHYHLGEYNEAYSLISEAYENSDKQWKVDAIKLIPLSLLKAGRYQEAEQWCQKIIKEHPENRVVQETIRELEEQISAYSS